MYNIGYILLTEGIATTTPMSFKFATHFNTLISYLFLRGFF